MHAPSRAWLGRRSSLVGSALLVLACGKPEPAAPDPQAQAPEPAEAAKQVHAEAASEPTVAPAPDGPRIDLEAEFHRTRVGPERGFWVLAMLHNTHDQAIARPEAKVRLLDVEGELVAEAIGELRLTLNPGQRAPVTVLVPTPVEHETLELKASGVAIGEPSLPLPLKLSHEDPQRADLGGWYVVGQVQNTGTATIVGARLEVQGLDAAGELLGVDWVVLDDVGAGETIEFDVGGLRYEEVPASFALTLRPP